MNGRSKAKLKGTLERLFVNTVCLISDFLTQKSSYLYARTQLKPGGPSWLKQCRMWNENKKTKEKSKY